VVKAWRLPAAEASKMSNAEVDKLEEFVKVSAPVAWRARASAQPARGPDHP